MNVKFITFVHMYKIKKKRLDVLGLESRTISSFSVSGPVDSSSRSSESSSEEASSSYLF